MSIITLPRRGRSDSGPAASVRRPTPYLRGYRPDIEGLRAFAVVAVVLYHADLGHVRGGFVGVDVFFVISGFLITRQLLGTVPDQGLRALPTFYTRRIRRLLPAAAAVVVCTVLAARIWAPALRVRSIATDAIYTGFYGLNYRLAHAGTQYLNAGATPSPLQHFWSLGVEEQFYVVWPVLMVLVLFIAGRWGRPALGALLLGVTATSLWFSITVTERSAPWAYFSLHTRAWELGAGALVAISAERVARAPRLLAELMTATGCAAVVASAFVIGASTAYPGYAAALPVGATALVLAGGAGRRTMVEHVLAEPVVQGVGRISYSWYLWHVPLLIIGPWAAGHALGWERRLDLVLLSLALAVLSYFAVENPVRRLRRSTGHWFRLGGALTALSVIAGAAIVQESPGLFGTGAAVHLEFAQTASPAITAQMEAQVAAGLDVVAAPSNLTPVLAKAANDLPESYYSSGHCHATYTQVAQGSCVYGDPAGTKTVVLLGDSHVQQWEPALVGAADSYHWRIVNWTKAACPVADLTVWSPQLNRTYTECDEWRAATIQKVLAMSPRPDLVIAGQSDDVPGDSISDAVWAGATAKTLGFFTKAAIPVDFFLDTPFPAQTPSDCVAAHLSDVRPCSYDRASAYHYPTRHAAVAKAVAAAGASAIEPESWVCAASRCPVVTGNILMYRDTSHLTATFSRWLAPLVAPLLAPSARASA